MGSAFAVWCGALDNSDADRVGPALARAREKTAVREGCVRHVLTTDRVNGCGWQGARSIGVYQNGGYWGTPVGWYIAALARVDRDAARAMAADYIGFLRAHTRPDGTAEAWEWFNPGTGRAVNPLHAATVAATLAELKNRGALRTAVISWHAGTG